MAMLNNQMVNQAFRGKSHHLQAMAVVVHRIQGEELQ